MMQSKKLAILLLVVVFLLGALTGALLSSLVNHQRVSEAAKGANSYVYHPKENMVEVLSKELELTPPQKERLGNIIGRCREQYSKLHEEYKPKCDVIKNQTRAEIFQILDDAQKAKFQAFIDRRNAEKEKYHYKD